MEKLNKSDFRDALLDAIDEYIATEQSYDDNARFEIDLSTMEVEIADGEEEDIPGKDTIDAMEMIKMSESEPGRWVADPEAVEALVEEYYN